MSKFRQGLLFWGIGLMLGAAVLMGVSCASFRNAEKYTPVNKGALAGMAGTDGLDFFTTYKGIKEGAIELHPLFGDKPSIGLLLLFKVTSFGIKWSVGHIWEKTRNWLWGGSTVISGAAVINNYKVWKEMEGRND